jgi:hypothetical protein
MLLPNQKLEVSVLLWKCFPSLPSFPLLHTNYSVLDALLDRRKYLIPAHTNFFGNPLFLFNPSHFPRTSVAGTPTMNFSPESKSHLLFNLFEHANSSIRNLPSSLQLIVALSFTHSLAASPPISVLFDI